MTANWSTTAPIERIEIDLGQQILSAFVGGELVARYWVSTGAAGADERNGSGGTPRGRHVVRARIGAGQPVRAVFVGRRPTGEVYTPALGRQYPARDWILGRILWLSGTEPGFNRLGEVDTMRRFIYIHGTPDGEPMGRAHSHGCVRMRPEELAELFERVPAGCPVTIHAP